MSLSSTSTIKHQLSTILGSKSKSYFETLYQFIAGRVSRSEFDESVRQSLDTAQLIQLHNALIISLFDASSHRRPQTPPPDLPKPPPRKRRRTLPYQGPDTKDDTLRSSRLKRWTVSVGKRERERLRMLQVVPPPVDPPRPRRDTDEIARERGVVLIPERGDPPGSRLPLHLASVTRAPTLQHISDRINLISAQHNLGAPPRTVSQLMMLAFEAKLKQLITHALTLTSTSHAISSIHPASSTNTHSSLIPHTHRTPLLTPSSFSTLFTLAPFTLPNSSAAAMRLALSPGDDGDEYGLGAEDSGVWGGGGREVRDQRWQMVALLGERSTVREALRGVRHNVNASYLIAEAQAGMTPA